MGLSTQIRRRATSSRTRRAASLLLCSFVVTFGGLLRLCGLNVQVFLLFLLSPPSLLSVSCVLARTNWPVALCSDLSLLAKLVRFL